MRTTYTLTVITAVLSMLFLTGCGDSIDHRLQRAQIALSSGKPDTALQVAEELLKEDPSLADAILIKAHAQVRLMQMDPARQTLEGLLAKQPDNDKARRLMLNWVFFRMGNLLTQSDYITNVTRQEQFDQAMQIGMQQVQWLREHEKSAVEADFNLARLLLSDIDRLSLLIRTQGKVIQRDGDATAQAPAASTTALENDRKQRREQAVKLLEAVVQTDARQFEAAELYAGLLTEEKRWTDLWALAEKLSRQENIPADLSSRLVLAAMTMSEGIKSTSEILAMGRALQDHVDQARRSSSAWRLTEARLALRAGELKKAQPILEQIVREEARNPIARYLLAQCLYLQKDLPKAKQLLTQLNADINSPEALTLYGIVLMELDELSMARDVLLRAMDLSPEDPAPRRAYLMVQSKANQLEQAGTAVEDFYQKNPADPKAIRFKMQFEQVRNRREAMLTLLSNVEKLRPLTDEHVSILVEGYLYLQEADSAGRYAQELARRLPDDLEAQLKLAQALLLQNRDEDVRKLLTDIRQKFPASGSADQMLGDLYLQRQMFDRSVELMNSVVEREPGNMEARFILARGLAGLALFDDALDQVNRVLEKNPRDARAHAIAARVYQVMGRKDKAAEHLSEIDPTEVSERSSPALLAELKLRQNQYDEAIDICNRALAMGNTDPTIRQILAAIYLQKNQPEQAEVNLLGLVRMQPNNAQVFATLTRFYIEQKQVERGLAEFAALQTLNEPLSRLAQANLLMNLGRFEEAIERVRPIYEPMIRARDVRALVIADGMARAIMIARRDPVAAQRVYDPMIQAGVQSAMAKLRQIEIAATRENRDQLVAKLEELAKQVGPDDKRVRLELIRRLMDVQRFEPALKLIEDWIQLQPEQVSVLRLKAEMFTRMGRLDDAVEVLKQTITRQPEDDAIRRQLAAVHVARLDYPAAEAVYLEVAQLDEGARINALTDLGQLFTGLGLYAPATETFARIEKEGKVRDPRVMLAMGRAYMALKKNDLARPQLEAVPEYAQQYAQAQVMLAQIDQAAGQTEAAQKRLMKLAAEPRTGSLAAFEMLKLNLRNRNAEELIRWSDQNLALDTLPLDLRRAWLNMRVLMADLRRDTRMIMDSLDRMTKLFPEAQQIHAARVLVFFTEGKIEQARLSMQGSNLLTSRFGPLAAAMLGDKPAVGADVSAIDAYIIAMSQGDVATARRAIDRLEPIKGIFASDLRMATDRPDAASLEMQLAFRQLAAALLAQRCNLSQMAVDTCIGLLDKHPYLTLAYAVEAQALMDMEQPTDRIVQRLRQNLPSASVTMYVSAMEANRVKDFATAVPLLEKLLEREPGNEHVRYAMTQAYTSADKADQAIPLLEKLRENPGSYAAAVANDLAYLLAEHRKERIDEAYALARKAAEMTNNNPAILDTLGWVQHLRGDSKAALEPLGRAISSLPNIPDVHYHIGSAYLQVGNQTWARYHLEEAARQKDSPIAPRATKAMSKLGG